MENIAERFFYESQSWQYERVLRIKERVYKTNICRNAYDSHSYLRGYCFSELTTSWKLLVDAPICEAFCESVSYVDKNPDKALFFKDSEAVLEELQRIVGIAKNNSNNKL